MSKQGIRQSVALLTRGYVVPQFSSDVIVQSEITQNLEGRQTALSPLSAKLAFELTQGVIRMTLKSSSISRKVSATPSVGLTPTQRNLRLVPGIGNTSLNLSKSC